MQAPYRSSPEHAIHGKPVRKSGSTDESEVPQREHGLLTPSESPDEEGTYALTRQFAHQPAGATCLELDFMQFAPFGGGKPICPVETDPKPIMIQDIERWLSAADTGKRKRNKYSDGR